MTAPSNQPDPTSDQLDEMVRATEPQILAILVARMRSRSRRATWASLAIGSAALVAALAIVSTQFTGGSTSPKANWALTVTCFDGKGTALSQVLLSDADSDPRLVCASLRGLRIVFGGLDPRVGLPQHSTKWTSSWVACIASTNAVQVYESVDGKTAPTCTALKLRQWKGSK